ncbi:MAG: hypothetical protein QT11_C0001G0977 [archaeon GW2011_AR20]|nr:MAG: hypothetical protein QT11_C0001G0977 [archaeon GW2011_AR20]MBS3161052.1 hypothetical protein [Candidatus Woesearchaeota archaeon]
MTWLTKELMLQYMVWYLDMHTAKNLFDLAEVAVVAKAELQDEKPNESFNILNQDPVTTSDPFLQYVLNHKIPDGYERNAVVFKNIAPILVALKIDKEKKLLQRIVDNCEGKTIGELMGWIKKARRGELHLNKLEIEKWSNKHGII